MKNETIDSIGRTIFVVGFSVALVIVLIALSIRFWTWLL